MYIRIVLSPRIRCLIAILFIFCYIRCYSFNSTRDDSLINLEISLMDSITAVNVNSCFTINIDKFRICHVLIRSNQIRKDQIDLLGKSLMDSFPKLKIVRIYNDKFSFRNDYPDAKNKIDKNKHDSIMAVLKQYNIKTECYLYEGREITKSNIVNNTNHLIFKQRIENIDKIHYGLNYYNYGKLEKLPADLEIVSLNSHGLKVIYDSIDLEISNCKLLDVKILNGYKEKYIDTGDLSNPMYVNSKIKSLHISLKDSMSCRELIIQKPIGNLPITFNNNFKNSIEKITIWNPLCLMIPEDVFRCVNLQELRINLLGYKGHLSKLSNLIKLKKLSLYNCHSLSPSQKKELLNCKTLIQLEELSITFCPSSKFLDEIISKCQNLKRLNLDPNTLAMLCSYKSETYSISNKWLNKLNTFDSFSMILNPQTQFCSGVNSPLSCAIQNDLFNDCEYRYFEIDNSNSKRFKKIEYMVPPDISKYLEIYYCSAHWKIKDIDEYDLRLKLLELFYLKMFKNFSLTHIQ